MKVTRKVHKKLKLNAKQKAALEDMFVNMQQTRMMEPEQYPDENVEPIEYLYSFEECASIKVLQNTEQLPENPKENEGYQVGNDYWVYVNGEWVTRTGNYGIEELDISGEFVDDKSNSPKRYVIKGFNASTNPAALSTDNLNECVILMQNGTLPQVGRNGVFVDELLTVCRDVLESYQSGQFACEENEVALNCVVRAIASLQARHQRRVEQGTEGTYVGN